MAETARWKGSTRRSWPPLSYHAGTCLSRRPNCLILGRRDLHLHGLCANNSARLLQPNFLVSLANYSRLAGFLPWQHLH